MPAKILVIEDDQVTQDLLAHLLRVRGHAVTTVADGDAAIEVAAFMPPDLVLCDINLPTTNGFEVLQRLRQDDTTSAMPVIAITASGARDAAAEAQVRDRIMGLGFTAYIPKPIEPKTFAERIEGFLPENLRGGFA
jgi:CheY-like chemotaxis protein